MRGIVVRRWFGRLGRLYPGQEFELHDVVARGALWNLTIAAPIVD